MKPYQQVYSTRKTLFPVLPIVIKHAISLSTIFFLRLLFSATVAQTFPASCPSKDLELVSATLTGGDACNTCTPETSVTRTLVLGINNKTGSTRPGFAFWATLELRHTDNTVTTTQISRCSGPIPPTGPLPAAYTGADFGTITYTCGDALRLVDLHLAWTDAGNSPKNECSYILANPSKIDPKCGTLPSIIINTGVNGSFANTNATCAGNDGAINLTPFGGVPFAAPAAPYTYAWSSTNATVPAAQVNNQDLTGLAPGTYTCRITDRNNCFIDKSATITGSSLTAPAASVTQQPTCATATGVVTVTSPNSNYTYTLSQSNVVVYTANSSGVFGAVAIGTYTLKVSQGTCTTTGNDVTVNGQPPTPTFTVCLVQPTLCANSGSVTVTASGGNNFSYQLNSLTPQSSNVFSNLGSGSVTSIKVINGDGCSITTLCENLVISCPSATARMRTDNSQTTVQQIVVDEPTKVIAYPNPFSDNVKFVVTSSLAGKGSLEVYNMLGQKVKTVYQGQFVAGNQNFELNLPSAHRSNLIYVLRVGEKRITGKLLHLSR